MFQDYLDLRGTRLAYRLSGKGPALLLLHGWALDGGMWQALQKRLSRRYRVLAVDRRGYGRSSGRPSIEREVDDLRILCQRLGLRNIAVLGMSQATRVALRLSRSRSLRISCLVLDGPPGPTRGEQDPATEDPPVTRYRALVASRGMQAFRREWAAHPLMRLPSARRGSRWLLAKMGRRYPGRDLRDAGRPSAPTRPLSPSRIRTPTLVLCGAEDMPARQEAALALSRQLPRAGFSRLPGAAHLPNLDDPQGYERTVARFLRRHARS